MVKIKLFFSKIGVNCWSFLKEYISKKFLLTSLSITAIKYYLVGLTFLLIVAIVLQIFQNKFFSPYRKLISKFICCFYIVSIVGLIFLFLNYETIPFLGYKFWLIFDIIFLIGYLIYILIYLLTKLPKEIKLYRDLELKKKYLERR